MSVPAQLGTRRLVTVLGVTFGVAVSVGNTVGAGILRAPGEIAAYLPEFWPFLAIWLAGGIYALLGANALSELATLVPRSGGQYVFVRRGLGDYAGFVVGWSDWISTCGTTALVGLVLGEYLVGLVPELRAYEFVALVIVIMLTTVQWAGVRWGGAAQNVTTVLKGVALLFFVGACFYFGTRNPAAAALQVDRETTMLLAVILSMQAVIYTYDGWTAPIYFSEEIKDPGRNIPRAMFSGLAVVIVVYLLVNIGFARVVPLPTLAGEKLAAAAVAQHMFGINGDTVLRLVAVLILFSAVNANVLMAPRVVYAMSNDRLFWHGASEVNRGGTPDIALLLSSILAGAFIVTGTFQTVIGKLAFFFVANYTLSFITLFVLRRREPAVQRPYRAWGHPLTTGLALVSSIAFLIGSALSDTANTLWAVVILFLSYPVYLLISRRGRVPS
ncbi:MAG TPA: APC family permease [Thermoanaerobaculia bacterium]|nr:APC family permease [Thermoanaerobaculia bacterium]